MFNTIYTQNKPHFSHIINNHPLGKAPLHQTFTKKHAQQL